MRDTQSCSVCWSPGNLHQNLLFCFNDLKKIKSIYRLVYHILILKAIYSGRNRRGRDRMVVGLTTTMQSVPITTNVNSNRNQAIAKCTQYNIM